MKLAINPVNINNKGVFSGILIPIINKLIASTDKPPNIFKIPTFTNESRLGPIPAAKITMIVDIIPANNAVIILSLADPSNNAAVKIDPGPDKKDKAIEGAFSILKIPEIAAIAIAPFNPPLPSINASLNTCPSLPMFIICFILF